MEFDLAADLQPWTVCNLQKPSPMTTRIIGTLVFAAPLARPTSHASPE
jgi:hypothetical protein